MTRLSLMLALVCVGALADEPFIMPRGFVVDTVYAVPKSDQGSWVGLAVAPNGDLVAFDQSGGLWHIALADPDKPVVTSIPVAIKGVHGLLFAHNALYVVVGEGKGAGIWRLRDLKGDWSFSDQVMLRRLEVSGEHGPHQLALARDGSLLIVAGNHTKLPADELPGPKSHWEEDTFLDPIDDPNDRAVGLSATGGWVARMNRDGTGWQRVTIGMRDARDLAVAPDGDVFVFDSDADGDIGAPWYRPARICLATPGGELGWRSGTANNPSGTIDTQPSILDVGPGDPTGIAFGTGTKFPARYQRALFACDRACGTLYAIHLKPNGAAWSAKKEDFAIGKQLPLADVVVRPQDGAMYLVVGGRGSPSVLYRVRYTGTEPTAPVAWHESTPEQKLRRELEELRLSTLPMKALDKAWPLMNHDDAWIRFAARIVVEAQPVDLWAKYVGNGPVTGGRFYNQELNLALSLARYGDFRSNSKDGERQNSGHGYLVCRACELFYTEEEPPAWAKAEHVRAILRVLEVYQHRQQLQGVPLDVYDRPNAGKHILDRLPTGDDALDRQYASLCVHVGFKGTPAKILQLMRETKADADLISRQGKHEGETAPVIVSRQTSVRIGLAVCLARAKAGWTPELRREFFDMLDAMLQSKDAQGLRGYLLNIRKAALENVPEAERTLYAEPKSPTPQPAR